MTDVDVYQGRARRRCPHCGVEIEIEKPTRVLSRSSTPAWRKRRRARRCAADLLGDALFLLQVLVERPPAHDRNRLSTIIEIPQL